MLTDTLDMADVCRLGIRLEGHCDSGEFSEDYIPLLVLTKKSAYPPAYAFQLVLIPPYVLDPLADCALQASESLVLFSSLNRARTPTSRYSNR